MSDVVYRELRDVVVPGWPKPKRLAVWSFAGCASVSAAVREAAAFYEAQVGQGPRYGFVRKLPGEESFREVGDVMVLEAEWMLADCVAVGG